MWAAMGELTQNEAEEMVPIVEHLRESLGQQIMGVRWGPLRWHGDRRSRKQQAKWGQRVVFATTFLHGLISRPAAE
jgi:hypothetical protein